MSKIDLWVENLRASIHRACDVVYDPIIRAGEADARQVFFRLTERLTPELEKHMKTYIRRYCRQEGWAMKTLTYKKGYVSFDIKPALPKSRREGRRTRTEKPAGL
jgi:hypothetical protein